MALGRIARIAGVTLLVGYLAGCAGSLNLSANEPLADFNGDGLKDYLYWRDDSQPGPNSHMLTLRFGTDDNSCGLEETLLRCAIVPEHVEILNQGYTEGGKTRLDIMIWDDRCNEQGGLMLQNNGKGHFNAIIVPYSLIVDPYNISFQTRP